MLTWEPSLKRRAHAHGLDGLGLDASPVAELTGMMIALRQVHPSVFHAFVRSCRSLELELSGGIAVMLRFPESREPLPPVVDGPPTVLTTEEEIFVACRDALTGDRTARMWRQRNATFGDLVVGIRRVTHEFEQGWDPREPW